MPFQRQPPRPACTAHVHLHTLRPNIVRGPRKDKVRYIRDPIRLYVLIHHLCGERAGHGTPISASAVSSSDGRRVSRSSLME